MKHLLSALVIAIMIGTPATGAEVTFSFRGTVHELDGEYNYFTGHPFEIVYTFESTTEDADPGDHETGSYIGAIKSGSLTIYTDSGPFKWVVEPDGPHNVIEVKNLDTADSYLVAVSISGPVDKFEIPAGFHLELIDRNGAVLSNDELPASLEIMSFNSQRVVKFTFIGVDKYTYSTLGIITSANTR